MPSPKIIKPGSKGNREVARWEKYMGVTFCIRKMAVQRVVQPDTGFTPEDEKKLESLIASLEKSRNKPASATEKLAARREKREAVLEAEINELIEARSALDNWEQEQIQKCMEGHGTLVGVHYFYHHFGWIDEVRDGVIFPIRPDYRSADDWAFRFLKKAQDTNTGTVVAKRRRFGWSWLLVAFVVWNLLFRDGNVFFVSKDEDDQQKFYSRINSFIERLPDFLKKDYIRDAIELKELAPSEKIARARGISVDMVPKAVLRCASPTRAANVSGGTCSLFIVDEAGEIANLPEVLAEGEPMLAAKNGIDRAGAMLLGGTVGKMDKAGHVFRKIYMANEAFDLMRGFITGWMGTYMDRFGNDKKELAIEKIENKILAFEREGMIAQATGYKQKFPTKIEDAFRSSSLHKLWPSHKIEEADIRWNEKPPKVKYGMFIETPENEVVFRQQEPRLAKTKDPDDHIGHGQVQIIEEPSDSARVYMDPYTAGCDPVDLDKDMYRESGGSSKYILSDFAFVIGKRFEDVGSTLTGYPVCLYYGREPDLEICFEQTLLACRYYGAKINIERQKGARLYAHFKNRGYEHLVAFGTGIAMGTDRDDRNWGFHTNERWWNNMINIGKQRWNGDLCYAPLVRRFIDESMDIMERNTDLMVAWLAEQQLSREFDQRELQGKAKFRVEAKKNPINLYTFRNGYAQPTSRPGPGLLKVLQSQAKRA